jgi:PAS domain S-box-containing protein
VLGVDRPPHEVTEDRQLALLVAGARDYAIVLLDPQGHVLTWNAGAEEMQGYTHEEITGRHFSVFYTQEDAARGHPAEELRLAILEGRYEEEGWRVRKDGTRFWANVVITPVRDETGALIGFGKVSRDLSARRRHDQDMQARTTALEAVNAELDEFRRLVASVRDYAIFMLDPGGHIRSWNAGAERLKGYAPDEIIGRHFSIFYTREDRERRHPELELEIAVSEGRYEEEGWRVRKDGTVFWASVTITAVHDDRGALSGFAKVTRDLTARREAELALQSAVEDLRTVNAELDRFAAVAAHDLTDPLRTISGFAELLERAGLPEVEHEYARHIRQSSVRLTRMLDGLLTYARAGQATEEREPVRLEDAARDALADLAGAIREREAETVLALPADAAVLASSADVRIVVQNLVSNALKFGDQGSPEVRIEAELLDGGAWRVGVLDNGPGVPPADRERIFDAFQRGLAHTGGPGYGLGLAICQRLVERHGGELGVEPAPERGSCFWFALPAATPVPAAAPPAARRHSPA